LQPHVGRSSGKIRLVGSNANSVFSSLATQFNNPNRTSKQETQDRFSLRARVSE
jgi:hypothetical protein